MIDLKDELREWIAKNPDACPICLLDGLATACNYLQSNDGSSTITPQALFKASQEVITEYEHAE